MGTITKDYGGVVFIYLFNTDEINLYSIDQKCGLYLLFESHIKRERKPPSLLIHVKKTLRSEDLKNHDLGITLVLFPSF